MATPEKVTISIDVKMPDSAEFCHCKIVVDMSSGNHAAVEIQQMGDTAEANNFTLAWLKSAVSTFQKKSDANLMPKNAH